MLRDIHAKLDQENLMQEGSPRPLFPHLFPHRWALLTGQPPPLPHTGADVPHLLPTGAVPTGRGGHQDSILMDRGVQLQTRRSEQTWSRFPGSAAAQGSPKSSSLQEVREGRSARHRYTQQTSETDQGQASEPHCSSSAQGRSSFSQLIYFPSELTQGYAAVSC